MRMRRGWWVMILTVMALSFMSFIDGGAIAAQTIAAPENPIKPDGAKIFSNVCSTCHIGGTNVLVAQKNLEQETLEKFAMDSVTAIQKQVTQGKNAMPAFGKKLSEPEIAAVAGYVLHQAQSGW
jgi:cytochrome c6